jgi:ABC-type lipoprotein release transport system permease subunit
MSADLSADMLEPQAGFQHLSLAYVCMVAIVLVSHCQIAVLWPALRAAAIAPAQAIRNL